MIDQTGPVTFELTFPIDIFPDHTHLSDWILNTASHENCAVKRLTYVLVNDDELLKLNKQYLDHDTYTDILTFPYSYEPIEADIYISFERVEENASKFGVNVITELKRVIIHGLLHMCGYGDATEEEKTVMRSKEDFYLSLD